MPESKSVHAKLQGRNFFLLCSGGKTVRKQERNSFTSLAQSLGLMDVLGFVNPYKVMNVLGFVNPDKVMNVPGFANPDKVMNLLGFVNPDRVMNVVRG